MESVGETEKDLGDASGQHDEVIYLGTVKKQHGVNSFANRTP